MLEVNNMLWTTRNSKEMYTYNWNERTEVTETHDWHTIRIKKIGREKYM